MKYIYLLLRLSARRGRDCLTSCPLLAPFDWFTTAVVRMGCRHRLSHVSSSDTFARCYPDPSQSWSSRSAVELARRHPGSLVFSIVRAAVWPDCPSHHVGETSKTIGTRVKEHRQAVGRLDPKSLVFAHAVDRNHTSRYEDAEVISVDTCKGGRLNREAWYSVLASMNRHITLHPAYKAIRLLE